jgi:hypothetical protein
MAIACRYNDDALDQALQNLHCLIPDRRLSRGRVQRLDLPPIDLREVGMEAGLAARPARLGPAQGILSPPAEQADFAGLIDGRLR